MKKLLLSKKIIFSAIIVCIFLLLLLILNINNIKNTLTQNSLVTKITPPPTPVKYTLPNPNFSGLRQTASSKGQIREIIGKVISFNKGTHKIKIGDEAIPFMYDLNISTVETLIVDEVSVDESGFAQYTPSEESRIVPGIRIIGDCPDEKVDPACLTIRRIHIIKE